MQITNSAYQSRKNYQVKNSEPAFGAAVKIKNISAEAIEIAEKQIYNQNIFHRTHTAPVKDGLGIYADDGQMANVLTFLKEKGFILESLEEIRQTLLEKDRFTLNFDTNKLREIADNQKNSLFSWGKKKN